MEPKFYPPAPFRFRRGDSLRGQMMEMLKYLRLAVCVVCIAAFASGCGGGGGGGGSAMEEETPVMECPQGQVGTYPNCMDPPPTDEQRIDAAQDTLAGIIADARTREGLARADASAVEGHEDATEAQKTSAGNLGDDARNALTDIVTASAVVNVATTGAQAEGAVSDAQTALNALISAQSSLASLLSAVNAVAGARRQLEEDEKLATNGSSLIMHVRDNKLVYDTLITGLKAVSADTLVVGDFAAGTSEATFPATTGTAPNLRPGVRGVTVNSLNSTNHMIGPLTGPSRFSNGFDLKSGTSFVNAYTDINRENPRASTGLASDGNDANGDERFAAKADADYLLLGIWLDTNGLKAFAYGGQPLGAARPGAGAAFDECNRYTGVANTTCTSLTTGFGTITSIVPTAGEQETATYNGDANGAYLAGGKMSYFEADVSLTAVFRNGIAGADPGNIEGEVTNIVAGGKSISGSIELRDTSLTDDITGVFPATGTTLAVGVVGGESYRGGWKGQFFGQRISSPKSVRDTTADPVTTEITFSPLMPGSVAGTFNVVKESGAGDAAFIGAFGAHR